MADDETGTSGKGQGSTGRVQEAAAKAGLDITVIMMPGTTRTAVDAASACGCAVGQIVKSLIFRLKGSRKPVLILVSGSNRVDQEAVASQIGDTLERMDAGAVRAETGFAIGDVAPIGATAPLAVYMDQDLLTHETIWAAAGAPNKVFQTSPGALRAACQAKIVKVTPQ